MLERIPRLGLESMAVREFRLPAFQYPWHQHPELELTWILRGSGLRYVGDSVEPFHAGDFCLVGTNLPHTWLSRSDDKLTGAHSFVIQFDPEKWGNGFLQLPEMGSVRKLLAQARCGLAFPDEAGRRLIRRVRRPLSPLMQFVELLRILDELAANPDTRSLSLTPWRHQQRSGNNRRLERVLAYLSGNFKESISHAEAASVAGLSPAAFSRYFRRNMGKTFQQYLNDMRLSEACRQLIETTRPVSEIAFDSGFQNLSTFNRCFRNSRSMSPVEYRAKARFS